MINDTIQIFASDHRANIEWNLPFTRISHSSDVINLKSDDFLWKHKDLLSESAKMIFIYKHIKEFGNPNYIGFCHYRRYFAICHGINQSIIEDFNHKLSNYILGPIDQLCLIKKSNADGILEFPFLDSIDTTKYQTIVDMFKYHVNPTKDSGIQNRYNSDIPHNIIDRWIDNFRYNLPIEFKPYFEEAITHKDIYHSNIFTMRKDICDIYFPLLNSLIVDMINFIDNSNISITNCRWLGFLIEYLYSNVFFHILAISKKFKFMQCQLLVQ